MLHQLLKAVSALSFYTLFLTCWS